MATRYNIDNYDPLKDNEYWLGFVAPNSDTPEDIEASVVEPEEK
jgi:hypothetical protein